MADSDDSFAKDLDDLGDLSSDDDDDDVEKEEDDDDEKNGISTKKEFNNNNNNMDITDDKTKAEGKLSSSSSTTTTTNNNNKDSLHKKILGNIADSMKLEKLMKLKENKNYIKNMTLIKEHLLTNNSFQILGPIEEHPVYQLVTKTCTELIQQIEDEKADIHKYVEEIHIKRFPELPGLVPNPIDYLRTVHRLGNDIDTRKQNSLDDLLPTGIVMNISIAGQQSSSRYPLLKEHEIRDIQRGCDEFFRLEEDKMTILSFINSLMNIICPNVCHLIGTRLAAQLMGLAGGLTNLSRIPSSNLQVMGQEKNQNLAGFSAASIVRHAGIIYYADLVQQCTPEFRKKALKVLAGKVALAVRNDITQTFVNKKNGDYGRNLHDELQEKFRKWEEPDKARNEKALPVPMEKKKNRRGGKRVRKFKEKFAETEITKAINKRAFGDISVEYGDDAMGNDFGMLSANQIGKMRGPQVKKADLKTKKQRVREQQMEKRAAQQNNNHNLQINGLQTSLMTPTVGANTGGIEFSSSSSSSGTGISTDMNNNNNKVKEANKSWFGNSGFASAKPVPK